MASAPGLTKVKDSKTGRVYYIDEDNNEVAAPKAAPKVQIQEESVETPTPGEFNPKVPLNINLKDAFNTGVYNYGGRFVPEAFTAMGGILGGATGSPLIGGAAGAGIGSLVGKGLQKLSPEWFGEYNPGGPGGVALDVGIDVAADAAGTKVAKVLGGVFPSVRKNFVQNRLRKWFSPDIPEASLNALRTDPNFDVTVGQTNSVAKLIEDYSAPTQKAAFTREQNKKVVRDIQQYLYNPEVLVEDAQVLAKQNVQKMQGAVRQSYAVFEPHKFANTRQVAHVEPGKIHPITGKPRKSKVTLIDVPGAIPVNESGHFAEELGAQLDEVLGPDVINPQNIGTGTSSSLNSLRREINKIRQVQTLQDPEDLSKPAERLASYDQLKAIQQGLNDYIFSSNTDDVIKGRLKGGMQGLAATIDQDIEQGVKSWGKDAYSSYRRANDNFQRMAQKVNPQMAKDLVNAGANPETTYLQVARDAISDPQKTRQFVEITNDRETVRKIFSNDLIDSAMDPASGIFNADRAISYMSDQSKRLVADEVMSPLAKSGMMNFFKRAQLVAPFEPTRAAALQFTTVRAGFSLVLGGGLYMAGGNPLSSTVLGGAIFFSNIGFKQFAKRVLMNPRNAKIATGLLNVDPKSKTAQVGTKVILGLMKGAQVSILSPDGIETPGYINNKGKVEPYGAEAPEEP